MWTVVKALVRSFGVSVLTGNGFVGLSSVDVSYRASTLFQSEGTDRGMYLGG